MSFEPPVWIPVLWVGISIVGVGAVLAIIATAADMAGDMRASRRLMDNAIPPIVIGTLIIMLGAFGWLTVGFFALLAVLFVAFRVRARRFDNRSQSCERARGR